MNFQSVQSKQMLFFVGVVVLLISAYMLLDFGKKGEGTLPSSPLVLTAYEGDVGLTLERITKRGGVSTMLPEFSGKIIDYARAGGTEVLIRNEEGVHIVQVREGEGEWYEISRSPYEKRGVAVSRDGTYVAYVERDDVISDGLQFDAWTVYVYDREEKELVSIADGYNPQFLTFGSGENMWEGLVFSASGGIGVLDTHLAASEDTAPQIYGGVIPKDINTPVFFSERMVRGAAYALVYDPIIETYGVFTIADTHLALSAGEQIEEVDSVLGIHKEYVYFVRDGELFTHRIGTNKEPRRSISIEREQGGRILSLVSGA